MQLLNHVGDRGNAWEKSLTFIEKVAPENHSFEVFYTPNFWLILQITFMNIVKNLTQISNPCSITKSPKISYGFRIFTLLQELWSTIFSKFPSFLLIFKQNRSLLFCHILSKMRPMFCHINQKVPETGWSLKICLVHEVYPSLPWLRQPVLNHRNSSWVCLADIIPQSVVWQKKVKAWNYQSVLCNFHAVIYACHINHLAAHIYGERTHWQMIL